MTAVLAEDISLIESLRFAVPLMLVELAAQSTAWLVGEAKRGAALVGTYGDIMQFAGRAEPTSRQRNNRALAFNGLARGLACICLVEGAVDFHGLHWCVCAHAGCPNARPPREPVTEAEIKTVIALLNEYEDALDRHGRIPRTCTARSTT